jgi:hypothetical protein
MKDWMTNDLQKLARRLHSYEWQKNDCLMKNDPHHQVIIYFVTMAQELASLKQI